MPAICKRAPLPAALFQSVEDFLAARGLRDEGDAEVFALLYDDSERLVACGARAGRLLKQIAVAPAAEGGGACASIVSALLSEAYTAGETHLFLCTKPENGRMFRSLGFFPLAETPDALLMENRRDGLERFLSALPHPTGRVGAVVCNCNPFTLGHRHLIATAVAACDAVHVFVLSEEASLFSAAERLALVRAGVADLSSCFVHESAHYLVSRATFPAYFIRDAARAEDVRADLDLTLFASRIAPALGISVRFVGEEPFCPVTRAYNERMKSLLPQYGVEVVEIPRLCGISASRVRALMQERKLDDIRALVPEESYAAIVRRLTRDA